MFDSIYKMAMDGTLYAIDRLLEANWDAYTCQVRPLPDDKNSGGEGELLVATSQHSNLTTTTTSSSVPSTTTTTTTSSTANGGRRTKRRIIKLRVKVSKEQCAKLDAVTSPPLSPTSLASAECIPHPEYISISGAKQSSSVKKRLSVRTFRRQFNLSTIPEELEEEMAAAEVVKMTVPEVTQKGDLLQVSSSVVVERSRA